MPPRSCLRQGKRYGRMLFSTLLQLAHLHDCNMNCVILRMCEIKHDTIPTLQISTLPYIGPTCDNLLEYSATAAPLAGSTYLKSEQLDACLGRIEKSAIAKRLGATLLQKNVFKSDWPCPSGVAGERHGTGHVAPNLACPRWLVLQLQLSQFATSLPVVAQLFTRAVERLAHARYSRRMASNHEIAANTTKGLPAIFLNPLANHF